MINPFICGSFHHQEKDDNENLSPCSTPKPKRSKRSGLYKKNKELNKENPYANRGLDKFNALLAGLEEKKQSIYTQNDAEEISILQFAYSNNNQINPIVVKKKNPSVDSYGIDDNDTRKRENEAEDEGKQRCFVFVTDFFKVENLKKPCYYLPVILILILVMLMMFGRSFVILCTSIWWYLIPAINGRRKSSADEFSRSGRKMMRTRKEEKVTRKLGEKYFLNNNNNNNKNKNKNKNNKNKNDDGSSSPRSVMNGPVDMSPRHKRSW